MVKYHYSSHALFEMGRRNISRTAVDAVIASPGQKTPEYGDITCYQSIMEMGRRKYLLRVMVNEHKNPHVIVTVYRTGKIDKYWRKHESDL